MFIKNQSFKDEETLLEQLFDFSLGKPSTAVQHMISEIDKEVSANEAFQKYRATLTDEEDILELDAEERNIRLGEQLMEIYSSFLVSDNKLFGVKDDEQIFLYELDLY
jgi:hypothetical protein